MLGKLSRIFNLIVALALAFALLQSTPASAAPGRESYSYDFSFTDGVDTYRYVGTGWYSWSMKTKGTKTHYLWSGKGEYWVYLNGSLLDQGKTQYTGNEIMRAGNPGGYHYVNHGRGTSLTGCDYRYQMTVSRGVLRIYRYWCGNTLLYTG